jgi:hypothetical protein
LIEGELRLSLGKLRLRLVERGLIGTRIDPEERRQRQSATRGTILFGKGEESSVA